MSLKLTPEPQPEPQSLVSMVTHRGRPVIDPKKVVEHDEAVYRHALAHPAEVAARKQLADQIARESRFSDPRGTPAEYGTAFNRVASFIRDETWEGARFQADLSRTPDLDTIVVGSVRAYVDLIGGKSAYTGLAFHRTSTGAHATAEMRPTGHLHADLGGKITRNLAGSLKFVVDGDSVTESAAVSARHSTSNSTLAVSVGKAFLGPLTAAASYVQRYGKFWTVGAKTEYDSSKHPNTNHEVTVATYRTARNTPFVGLDNTVRQPPADGAMLRVAADHCAVTYHRTVNHALSYEAEFSLGQRQGNLESMTKAGLRWMTPQGSVVITGSTKGHYTSEIKYMPIEELALGACSLFVSDTSDLRLGCSLSLGQQYENFPRATHMIQPSGQWWRRTRYNQHSELTQNDNGPDTQWGWKGIPTFSF